MWINSAILSKYRALGVLRPLVQLHRYRSISSQINDFPPPQITVRNAPSDLGVSLHHDQEHLRNFGFLRAESKRSTYLCSRGRSTSPLPGRMETIGIVGSNEPDIVNID